MHDSTVSSLPRLVLDVTGLEVLVDGDAGLFKHRLTAG